MSITTEESINKELDKFIPDTNMQGIICKYVFDTCIYFSCKNKITVKTHRVDENGEKINTKYCTKHECKKSDCYNVKRGYKKNETNFLDYCFEHNCNFKECTNPTTLNSWACIVHTCQINSCNNTKSHFYNRYGKVKPYEYCLVHRCERYGCRLRKVYVRTCKYHAYYY